MPESFQYPGVHIEEIPSRVHAISGVDTSITAFVGTAILGTVGELQTIWSFSDFERLFGGLHRDFPLGYAVRDFFVNGGSTAIISRVDSVVGSAVGSDEFKAGIDALEKADLFNLLCILPAARNGDVPDDVYQEALSLCVKRRAFLIVDSKSAWTDVAAAQAGLAGMTMTGHAARNAALYFPRITQRDPEMDEQVGTFPACGVIAGVIATMDARRGVWKAPAGNEAVLSGVDGFQVVVNDAENRLLNPLGINCLRSFPGPRHVVWGARTLRGADAAADEYKYIPVRRTALFIEESLSRGLKWVAFEPNGDSLWSQIRRTVEGFMYTLFKEGAFQGSTPRDAYLVQCGADTTTQNDIDRGVVNLTVGFAPLKPAEFVIIQLQLLADQAQG